MRKNLPNFPQAPSPAQPEAGAWVAVDTEGSGLYADDGARVSVISYAWRDSAGTLNARALPFGQGATEGLFDSSVSRGEEWWGLVLASLSGCKLIMHNAAHDVPQIAAGAILGYAGVDLEPALAWDTLVVQKHLDPLHRGGLEDSCVRRLGLDPWKAQLDPWIKKSRKKDRYGKLQPHYELLPWDVIEPYATDDAVNTYLLYEDQRKRISSGEGVHSILKRELALTHLLIKLEYRGIRFDAPACLEEAATLRTRMQSAQALLPPELQPPTPHKINRYYYDNRGYLPTKWDKSKEAFVRSADDLSRKGLRDQGAPYMDELDEWLHLETALTMWYQTWPERVGPDGRLRMRIRQTKVSSGRFSGERVNLLAIPHEVPDGVRSIRSMISPADGKALYEIDLSQAEVRVGCVAAQCIPMMDEYRKGEGADVYAKAALELFGVTPEHSDFKHYRNLCKRLVLATLYAAGAKTVCVQVKKFMGIDMEESEAQGFLDVFREQYPEYKRAERYWMRYVESHGYVKIALGERRYFQPYEATYKALNQRIQASVAVGMKVAMLKVEDECPGAMLLQTHDSLLMEIDQHDKLTVPTTARIMERTFADIFGLPFIAEVKGWEA